MLEQVIYVFAHEWSPSDTLWLFLYVVPLLLPLVFFTVLPSLRNKRGTLLMLFSFFVALVQLALSYFNIFFGQDTASLYGWSYSRSIILLGLFHGAVGLGIFTCLLLGRLEWIKGILAVLALQALASGGLHLFEAFLNERINLTHLGPPLWHDILLAVTAVWVLKTSERGVVDVYYVPR